VVRWGGSDRVTNYNGPTQLTAQITAADIQDGVIINLTVFNTGSGLLSAQFPFTVNNPAPILSSLLPDNTPTGSADTMVTVSGSNFVPSSVFVGMVVRGQRYSSARPCWLSASRPLTWHLARSPTSPSTTQHRAAGLHRL
jgi:hypothetical protein